MNLLIPDTPLQIECSVKLLDQPLKSIHAFVDVQITNISDESILFVVRGYNIKLITFNDKPTFILNAPGYKSGYRFKKSFLIDNKDLWFSFEKAVMSEFYEQNGGKNASDYLNEGSDDVNIDEIAKALS